ncbi:hypothetical protein AB1N83_010345 [Pleurotus pulmonarius]
MSCITSSRDWAPVLRRFTPSHRSCLGFDGAAKPSARNSSSVKQIHDRTTPFCWLPRHARFSKPSSEFRPH